MEMIVNKYRFLLVAFLLAAGVAMGHQSKEVAGGAYRVIAGYMVNPAYSGQLNGLDLMVRDADGEPVANLEQAITAVLIAPDGSELELTLRAGAEPGHYTADFIPTVAGNFMFRISGFIGAEEFEELFDHVAHNEPPVMDAATISLP